MLIFIVATINCIFLLLKERASTYDVSRGPVLSNIGEDKLYSPSSCLVECQQVNFSSTS